MGVGLFFKLIHAYLQDKLKPSQTSSFLQKEEIQFVTRQRIYFYYQVCFREFRKRQGSKTKGSQFLLKLIWVRVVINFGIIYVGRDHQPPSHSRFHMVRLPRIVSTVEYLGWD